MESLIVLFMKGSIAITTLVHSTACEETLACSGSAESCNESYAGDSSIDSYFQVSVISAPMLTN